MHSFASVFMCFHCLFTAETCTFGTFHMHTIIHMYHILYMKCTNLLVFSCVFNIFSLQRHVLLIHVTNLPKKHVPYIIHEMHSFASVFMCFHWVFFAETCSFCAFHMLTSKHMYHILYMKCTVLLVFLLSFHCRTMYFWYISYVYQNTNVPYIVHKIHSFACVFM
jgi:hypothetical protein